MTRRLRTTPAHAIVLGCLLSFYPAVSQAQETGRAGRGLIGAGIESAGVFPEEVPNAGSMEYTVPTGGACS